VLPVGNGMRGTVRVLVLLPVMLTAVMNLWASDAESDPPPGAVAVELRNILLSLILEPAQRPANLAAFRRGGDPRPAPARPGAGLHHLPDGLGGREQRRAVPGRYLQRDQGLAQALKEQGSLQDTFFATKPPHINALAAEGKRVISLEN